MTFVKTWPGGQSKVGLKVGFVGFGDGSAVEGFGEGSKEGFAVVGSKDGFGEGFGDVGSNVVGGKEGFGLGFDVVGLKVGFGDGQKNLLVTIGSGSVSVNRKTLKSPVESDSTVRASPSLDLVTSKK